MGLAARAAGITDHLPDPDMRSAAEQLSQILSSCLAAKKATVLRCKVKEDAEESVIINPQMARLLLDVMDYVKKGQAITLVPVDNYLTTQQAADILNVSRPYLIKVLEAGHLPHHKLGRHRRILAHDLFAYRDRRDALRAEALGHLINRDADLY
jgi:excisionase family DNA binding protein